MTKLSLRALAQPRIMSDEVPGIHSFSLQQLELSSHLLLHVCGEYFICNCGAGATS
jgi:hypothetical protein